MHWWSYLLLLFVPAALGLRWWGASPEWIFVTAGLGIVPLAAFMGRATDALAIRLGPRMGGLLNATFGNAAELVLALVALRRGLNVLVKASMTGSIIGNALLVLGLSFLVGGIRHTKQTFDRDSASLQSTLLVLAAIGLLVPSMLFHLIGEEAELNLSIEVSVVLAIAYGLSLVFAFTHPEEEQEQSATDEQPEWSPWTAAGILLAATAAVALLSELLTGAVEQGVTQRWNMSEVFVGVVLIAIIGNAAEHSTAVWMAYRNKLDIALHIAVGSSLQIALLVTPILVFASLVLSPHPLDLHFSPLEVVAVCASVIVVALISIDGRTHWMEGVLLLAVYTILALAFYNLPAASSAGHGH